MKKIIFILTLLRALSLQAQKADTTYFTILMSERLAGFSKTWMNSDGSYGSYMEYNDRGRGPSLTTIYKQNESGYPTSLTISGNDYMKNKVSEVFEWKDGAAKWDNGAEKMDVKTLGDMFYVSMQGSGGDLVKALKKSPNNTVSLLPSGSAKLILDFDYEFKLSNGSTIKLKLLGISGFGFTPNYQWVDANYQEFGNVSEWFTLIKKGYESLKPEMLKIQKEIENTFFYDLAKQLVEIPNGIAITHVTVFDSENARLLSDQTVLCKGNKIEAIGNATSIKIPAGYKSIDGRNKTLLPGLWDMHVHFGDLTQGIMHLAAGVTSVRDMANGLSLIETRKMIDDGKVIGPRIASMCGFIDGAGPYAGPTGEIINNAEEGIKAVNKYADLGYPQIKLYSSIKPEWVAPITAQARKRNMRVSGHIPSYMLAEEAIKDGYNEIQHVNMLFLNFLGKDKDTRTPARFSLVAQNAASFDFNGKPFKDFIQLMKSNNIVSDPTVNVFEELFTDRKGQPNPLYSMVQDRFPPQVKRSLLSGNGLPVPDGMDDTYKKSFDACLKFVKAMHDAGITIVSGTDAMAGFALHRELELYSKAGIPNLEVLKIATLNGARVSGREKDLGSIKTGKLADMVLVDGDPSKNMSDIRKVITVIKDGNIYDPIKLYESIAIKGK